MKKSRLLRCSFLCVFLTASFNHAWALTFTEIYIFGDSLSDTLGTTGGGVSNGQLWPAYLAPRLGLTYKHSANYAVAGAYSGDISSQLNTYLADMTIADPEALYVIWAGGNDIRTGGSGSKAASNVISAVNTLLASGATHILVPNMGDIGLAPVAGADSAFLTAEAESFNTAIDSEYTGSATIAVVDVFNWHHDVVADPSAFGLVNVTDSCLISGTGCLQDPTVAYLFFDLFHPTTIAHSLIADEFYAKIVSIQAPVDTSGTIKTPDGTDICAMVLASGQYMFSCNPAGVFSLPDLPRESNGTVKRQIYADGFFPKIDLLTGSSNDAVVMPHSGTCPSYNASYDPGVFPGSAGKRITITGKVFLQDSETPICAMVLANGKHMFSCEGSGNYTLDIPLDSNGQFKLQVYADGFAPVIQTLDEFSVVNDVRMARAVECQSLK
jgi:phospholipase/lecithinase/hemolysin